MSGAQRLGGFLARHPWHVGAAALATGLALATAPGSASVLAAGSAAAALALVRAPRLALAAAALLLAGAGVGQVRVASLDDGAALAARAPARLTARAVMLERPRPSRFGARAALEVVSGPARGSRVLALSGGEARFPPGAGPGTELAVSGALRRPRRQPGADFDFPAYLRRRGIFVELRLASARATGRRRGGLAGAVDGARRRAERGVAWGLSPPAAALARGMVLGEDEAIAEPVREDFRRSGLAHVLAVSGQNVMLLCALALPPLALLGLGPRARIAALLGLIAVYVPLAGAGPSLQRAAIMGAAGLVAAAAGRPASRWYALLLAAVATLALNPRLTADPGWQLSFAAVGGILWLGAPLRRSLRALPGPLADGLAMTVAATLATVPLLAHHFGAVSLAALPANALAMPAVAGAMWIGMVEAALGQLPATGLAGALAGVALSGLGLANGACLDALSAIALRFGEPPGAEAPLVLASPAAVALAYAGLVLAVVGLRRAARRTGPAATAQLAAWRRLPRARRAGLIAAGAAAALALGAWALAPPGPPDRLTVRFLDVGQGDATLVQSPEGAAILFDGGPPEGRIVRLLRRAGVRRLSAVVATHQSRDHDGGLPEVIERVPTDLFVDGGDGTRHPSFLALRAAVARRGIRRVVPSPGQTLGLPGLAVRFLGPPPRPPGPPPDDPNTRALVTVVSAGGFDLFLSGDAESPSLAPLDLPEVEAMKVPHHGSRDEGLPALLRRLRPQVAAIEVGKRNTYGHPTPQTVAALRAAVPAVYRTDRDGTVSLRVDRGGMRVETDR